MVRRFAIYGIAGWGMEILWTGIYSLLSGSTTLEGVTTLWMFPVYGCAVFLEYIHDYIRNWFVLFRGSLWIIIIWGIEYTSGLVFNNVLGINPWYYEGIFSVDNFVRLDYAPAWFCAGLIFEKIHDSLDSYGTYIKAVKQMHNQKKLS